MHIHQPLLESFSHARVAHKTTLDCFESSCWPAASLAVNTTRATDESNTLLVAPE